LIADASQKLRAKSQEPGKKSQVVKNEKRKKKNEK
jgi:hypothetical protein